MPSRVTAILSAGLLLLALFGVVIGQSPSSEKSEYLKTVRLADGIYAVFPLPGAGTSTNSGFVVNRNSVWVFDAFKKERVPELLEKIRQVTHLPVTRVVFSHYHHDHIDGIELFPEAISIGHVNMKKSLLSSPGHASADFPQLTYEQKIIFQEDDREVQVLHLGRYHTNGDSLLYLPREKIVFAGDLFSANSAGNMREGYLREWIENLQRLEQMDVQVIIPGHGDRVGSQKDIADYRTYITAFLREVEKNMRTGKSLEEIQQDFDLSGYRSLGKWARFIDTNIARAYRELKGKWTDY